jgi:hypothetical protein
MEITPAQLAARYWGYAAQCLTVARRQDKAADRLALVNMAQAWATLAEQAQRKAAEAEGGNGPSQTAGSAALCGAPYYSRRGRIYRV